ncbi:hypothetical protein ACSS6N_25010 [Peribacillus frigoritolerans]|uniref:hypothetical protein n=1 Tax=Peribacillus frigoritolerans TaxID=450367 RepID=UPI003F87D8D5
MKNNYLLSRLPIIAILLFSFSFAIYGEMQLLQWLAPLTSRLCQHPFLLKREHNREAA